MTEDTVREIIENCTDGRFLGIFGEETVNAGSQSDAGRYFGRVEMNIAKIMIPKISTVFLHEKDTIRQGLERFMVSMAIPLSRY